MKINVKVLFALRVRDAEPPAWSMKMSIQYMADYLVLGNQQPSVAAWGEQQVAGELSKDITALEGSQAKEKRRRTGKENWERSTGQTVSSNQANIHMFLYLFSQSFIIIWNISSMRFLVHLILLLLIVKEALNLCVIALIVIWAASLWQLCCQSCPPTAYSSLWP